MVKKIPAKAEVNNTSKMVSPTKQLAGELTLFIKELAGEEGVQIISCIGDSGTTDDKIEEVTKMKIAEIRSVLNHLHSYGLVEYTREKNLQTGWFTYTWRLNANRALQNFLVLKRREYEKLRTKLSSGDGVQLYRCQKSCNCLEFEKAIELGFRCPGCRGKLNVVDQEEELLKLERKITSLTSVTQLSTSDFSSRVLQS